MSDVICDGLLKPPSYIQFSSKELNVFLVNNISFTSIYRSLKLIIKLISLGPDLQMNVKLPIVQVSVIKVKLSIKNQEYL